MKVNAGATPVSTTHRNTGAAGSPSVDTFAPVWARAIAELVGRYAMLADGTAHTTVTVVDLTAHEREPSWLLCRSLAHAKRLTLKAGIDIAYLPCPQKFAPPAFIALGTDVAWLDWDISQPLRAPVLKPSGEPWQPPGPVVVLVGDGWRFLRQRATAVHYGRLYEWQRQSEWVAQEVMAFPPEAPGSLAPCLSCVNSAQFALPCGALDMMASLDVWASDGYLVVARGEGYVACSDLRLPEVAATQGDSRHGESLPFNFQWLVDQCADRGAVSRHVQLEGRDVVQFIMAGNRADKDDLACLIAPVAFDVVSGVAGMVRSIRCGCNRSDAQAVQLLLRNSGWDADVFAQVADPLAELVRGDTAASKSSWRQCISRVWDNRFDPSNDAQFLRGVAHISLACEDLSLAMEAITLLKRTASCPEDLMLQAQYLERTARPAEALAACQHALEQGVAITAVTAMRDRLVPRLVLADNIWRRPFCLGDKTFVLEPLDASHADAVRHQYRDPQIAVMTGLAPLTTDEEVRAWIDQRVRAKAASYALVHGELGMVGYGDLDLNGEGAFACFWIGVDFQGRGYAKHVALLMCELARANGVRMIWTSAFDDNVRSIRALKSSGFVPIPIRAQAPHDERTFFCWKSMPWMPEEAVRGLVAFCAKSNPTLVFDLDASPWGAAGAEPVSISALQVKAVSWSS